MTGHENTTILHNKEEKEREGKEGEEAYTQSDALDFLDVNSVKVMMHAGQVCMFGVQQEHLK